MQFLILKHWKQDLYRNQIVNKNDLKGQKAKWSQKRDAMRSLILTKNGLFAPHISTTPIYVSIIATYSECSAKIVKSNERKNCKQYLVRQVSWCCDIGKSPWLLTAAWFPGASMFSCLKILCFTFINLDVGDTSEWLLSSY